MKIEPYCQRSRPLLGLFAFMSMSISAVSAQTANPVQFATPLDLQQVNIAGDLRKRIDLSLAHLLDVRWRILAGEGHSQGWGADQIGRWLYAVTQIAALKKQEISELHQMVRDLLHVQQPDGAWGAGEWGHWGNSRGLLGLLEYWHLTRDDGVWSGLNKLGHYFFALYGPYLKQEAITADFSFNPEGDIEGLVALAEVTNDDRYLQTEGVQ